MRPLFAPVEPGVMLLIGCSRKVCKLPTVRAAWRRDVHGPRARAGAPSGARMRAVRTAPGLSLEALADRAHIHRTYVGSVERGERNVSLDNIYAIADGLGIEAARLVSDG